MTARILFHVQHLLGTGHLKRVAILGAALAESGFEVEIVSGGPPIHGLDIGSAGLHQLPPLRAADAGFKTLLDEHGQQISDAWKASRCDALLARFRALRPDIVITELFPFGRRMLEFELLPLIEAARAARPRPLILASLRDILVPPGDPQRATRAVERAQDWYDRVLVHGDENLIALSASFPAARKLSNVVYTGYVVPPSGPEPQQHDGTDEIIVSAGGSAVGTRLLETASAAQRLNGKTWRLLAGSDLPPAARAGLDRLAGPNLIVETARPDFRALLRRCNVSVSQAGYNTVMDILTTQARAVLVPIAAEGETEQAQRAAALAARGWALVIDENKLDAPGLAAAVAQAARLPRPDVTSLKLDGATATVRLVQQALAERRLIA